MSKRQKQVLAETDRQLATVQEARKHYGDLQVLVELDAHFKLERVKEAQKIGKKR